MTIDLKDLFRKLSHRWRKTSEQLRLAQQETEAGFLQGHLQGVSDGLVIAADDVDKVLSDRMERSPSSAEQRDTE